MKKGILLLSLLAFASWVSAQVCQDAKGATHCVKTAAAKTATEDATIVSSTCPKTGNVVYLRKSVSPATGGVSYQEVTYCQKTGAFVNVAPEPAPAVPVSRTSKAKNCDPDACSKPCGKAASGQQGEDPTGAKAKLASQSGN